MFFEDVTEGTEIPELVKGPYSVMGLAKFGAMIGDFYPAHYDHKWATESDRVPAVVVYGLQITVHMSQLLTDWIGPDGMLRKFGNRNLNQLYVGEVVVIKGKVTKKYQKDGQNLVDCTLKAETPGGKLVAEGYATVELPSRLQT
ncbi:MAG: hypothetical protein N3E40_01295 [Dehalococcoidia bacterium]|nr:hypothetical protein [Dehalococcoidia bacterium]